MKQFNIKRFGQLLKWWTMTNQGSLIKLAGGAVIITFLVEVLLMIDTLTVKDAALALTFEQRQVEIISGLMTFVFGLCVTFSGSYMSSGLNKKQHREAFLMVCEWEYNLLVGPKYDIHPLEAIHLTLHPKADDCAHRFQLPTEVAL